MRFAQYFPCSKGLYCCRLDWLGDSQLVCPAHAIFSRFSSIITSPALRTLHDGGVLDIAGKYKVLYMFYGQSVLWTATGPTRLISLKTLLLKAAWGRNGVLTKYFVITANTSIPFQMHFVTSLLTKPSHPVQRTLHQPECESVTTQTARSCPLCGGVTTAGHQDKAAVKR